MRMPSLRIVMLAVTVLTLSACSSSSSDESNSAPFDVPGEPVRTSEVFLPRSYRFAPPVIEIQRGSTVTWTNEDDFPHNVHLLDGSDLVRQLPIGDTATMTFGKPGVVYYECSIHPQQMHGKIIVEE